MLKVEFKFLLGLIMVGVLLMCIGCGESKLNTSSDQAFASSLEKMYKSVPEDERELFMDHLYMVIRGKVIISFSTGKRNVPSYDEIVEMYSLVKAMGSDREKKLINNLNGLTKAEIIAQGKAILEKGLAESQASLKKQRDEIQKQISEIQKQIETEKRLELEPQKVEVSFTGIDVREGRNFENKPWGAVSSIAAFLTVRNNSSETVKRINGKVFFTDETGNKIDERSLIYLLPVDQEDETSSCDDLKISPGEEWKGKVVLRFLGPDKKHPYPPTRKYTATISDVKAVLDVKTSRGYYTSANDEILKDLQQSLQRVETKLATQK